jgi:hypothetical protein
MNVRRLLFVHLTVLTFLFVRFYAQTHFLFEFAVEITSAALNGEMLVE